MFLCRNKKIFNCYPRSSRPMFCITAVREDRSPGGKHRVKRPRLEDGGVIDLNKKMEDVHLELIEKLMEAHPDRVPGPASGSSF